MIFALCFDLSWVDVFNVPMDGNCILTAIAHQLYILGIDDHQRSTEDVHTELVCALEKDRDMAAQVSEGLE